MRIQPIVIGLLAAAGTMTLWAGKAPQESGAPPIDEVKAVAKGYAGQLKAMLQQQMQAGGPVDALAVCSDEAARIGSDAARASGWSIRRVTDRTRNPLDMPDAYEHQVLQDFSKRLGDGEKEVARYEVVEEGGVRYARFMKAIPVEGLCLSCHGSATEVAPDVAARIQTLYPHDRAMDYKLGDLRGALSIKVRLD
ncbi:MAG: DUF3365 domain-containing protein [Thiohalobacteraceae bacterium]|nr:DUF3365 domain-containing protein [Gammaproteobacteria bacterium]